MFIIIPATPSNPQQPIQQPYVKRTSLSSSRWVIQIISFSWPDDFHEYFFYDNPSCGRYWLSEFWPLNSCHANSLLPEMVSKDRFLLDPFGSFQHHFFCVFEAETPSRHIEQNLQMKIRHIDISNGHSLGASCSKLPNQIIRWVKIQDIKWTTECFVYLSYQPSMFLGPVLTLSPDGKDSNLLSINIGHP